MEYDDKTKYSTFYPNSKADAVVNESDTDDVFVSNYTTIIWNMQKSLWKSLSWITNSIIDHNFKTSKHDPIAGCSYIKLPKKLNHLKKGLIDIQNIDDTK